MASKKTSPAAADKPVPKPAKREAEISSEAREARAARLQKGADEMKMMDVSAAETPTPVVAENNRRTALALSILVAEVLRLFPKVKATPDGYDGRNTALTTVFDLSDLSERDAADLTAVLELVANDHRVQRTDVADGLVTVVLHSNPRTQDTLETFRVLDILDVLGSDTVEDSDDPLDLL